ncbi:MAG: hypothetical protein L3J31_08640 [Bacteroidales bacterium]|nr:hypothetical protein [Bacteroidales bacterium]
MAVALVIGLFLVFLLSIAGNKSKGPVQSTIDRIANKVIALEEEYILKQRSHQRREKLAGFDALTHDIDALKNPKIILLGASDNISNESFETIIDLEDSLKTTFQLIHIYNAWGSRLEHEFPELSVETILKLGSVPVITWEPWLSAFSEEEYPGIPAPEKRDKAGLSAIANGTYDKYITEWATAAKNIKKPIFIRLAHEMNDPYRYPWGPQNNSPEEFKEAWVHIHAVFDSVGAGNIIWIWAPHPSYEYFSVYYPGDHYVDFVGVGVLNFGSAVTWSKWWTFDQLCGTQSKKLNDFHKPIMLTEFGSLNVGGDRPKWFADALKGIAEKYTTVKSVLFFHYPADNTITNKTVSWYFIDDKETKAAIIKQIELWPDSIKFTSAPANNLK